VYPHRMDGTDGTTIPGGRRPGEPSKAFGYFTTYREQGPTRSLAKVAREHRCSKTNLAQMSAQWAWVERAAEWDDYADAQARQRDLAEREESVRRMNERHAKIGREAVDVASRKIAEYGPAKGSAKQRAEAKRRFDELPVAAAARLLDSGSKLERLALGETTERLEVREAQKWVERMIPIALTYIPEDSHEAFLIDMDAVLGMGAGLGSPAEPD
jgi:hypothetical protein